MSSTRIRFRVPLWPIDGDTGDTVDRESAGSPLATSIPLVLGVREERSNGTEQALLFNAGTEPSPAPDEDGWAKQLWRNAENTGDGPLKVEMQFELFQPLPALLDFSLVRRMPYHSREICIPAIIGHFLVDNRLGSRPVEGFALLAEPGWDRLHRHEPGTIGWGRGGLGVAAGFERAAAAAGAELSPIRSASIDAAFDDADAEGEGACVGFSFTVPAGARRELHLSFGRYHRGGSLAGDESPVSWSRAFFGGLEDVLEQALMEDGRIVHAARQQHTAFTELATECSAEDVALVLAAVREPAALPVLLQGSRRNPNRPRVAFPAAAGLESALEHQFLNNALHPWVLRTFLEDTITDPSPNATNAPNAAHWLILAASSAAATRQHDWLARTTGGPEALTGFCDALVAAGDAHESAPIRWLASLAAAMLCDGLGQAGNAARFRDNAPVIAAAHRPDFEELLLPWTIAEYWQHLGTPLDLAPFASWRSVMAEGGCSNFNDACRSLGKRGGALGILLLGDRLVS